MVKFIILFIIGYLGYRVFKKWMFDNTAGRPERTVDGETAGQIDDIMVQDPQCQVYLPKRDGIHMTRDGNDYYFCSTECRDKYFKIDKQ